MSELNREFLENQIQHLKIPIAILDKAACRGVDPKIMDGETLVDIHKAQAICTGCPVRELCQEWAIWHEPYGVWAGLTPRQRAALRKGRKLIDILELNDIISKSANLFSGKTVKALAAEYGVTERTIYRWRLLLGNHREAS